MERNYTQLKENWKVFEKDTKNLWFPNNVYKCYHETPEFQRNPKKFDPDLLKPDFGFNVINSSKEFWVECKQRRIQPGQTILRIFKSGQRYRYSQHKNVIIFIQLIQQEKIKYYLIPLYKLSSDYVALRLLRRYRVWQTDFIKPGLVRKYLC